MKKFKKGDIVELVTRDHNWEISSVKDVQLTACGKILTRFISITDQVKGELLTSVAVLGDNAEAKEFLRYKE